MATEERLILDSAIDTTGIIGIGQALANFPQTLPSSARYFVRIFWQIRPRTLLETIIDDLERLEQRSNYLFKPSKRAMRSAKLYIFETYAKMLGAFPRPFFVLDGEKGIIIKWVANGRTVRLNCLPNEGDQDYIYFENGEYDVEDDVTPDTLRVRLNWLTQHEPEPAR